MTGRRVCSQDTVNLHSQGKLEPFPLFAGWNLFGISSDLSPPRFLVDFHLSEKKPVSIISYRFSVVSSTEKVRNLECFRRTSKGHFSTFSSERALRLFTRPRFNRGVWTILAATGLMAIVSREPTNQSNHMLVTGLVREAMVNSRFVYLTGVSDR